MVNQIDTFDLNVHMHQGFDCDDVHLKLGNLIEDSGPIVHSILTPNEPSSFESIIMPSDLDEEVEIAWEVLKVQFILN
jgi:hypothetical protein